MAFAHARKNKRRRLTQHPEHLLAALVCGCLTVASFALYAIESHHVPNVPFVPPVPLSSPLHIWFFDIGQGDATFIEMPDGQQVLIDGGPDDAVLAKLGSVMPPWDHSIDMVVATHPDADHIAGLADVITRYDVANILDNGDAKDTHVMDRFVAARDAEPDAALHTVRQGDTFTFGDVKLTALWPVDTAVAADESNYGSIVFLLTYGDTSVILPGDATKEAEASYGTLAGDVDVLKAGHHGSNGSSSAAFLDTVTPEVAIFSCGVDNRYGHPHPAVVGRMNDRHIQMFRTDHDGDILLTSFGDEPEVAPSPLPF